MSQFPETRISLILRLGQSADVQAWQEFAEIYAPALHGLALRKGLQPADADDVTQEVLFGVARAIERFEPNEDRASFRTWLSRIARNLIADFCRRRARKPASQLEFDCRDEGTEFAVLAERELDAAFESEYRMAVFHLAARQIRTRVSSVTWDAFFCTCIQGEEVASVADKLGISPGGIYVARSRVLKMLRLEVQRLEEDYGEGQVPHCKLMRASETQQGESA